MISAQVHGGADYDSPEPSAHQCYCGRFMLPAADLHAALAEVADLPAESAIKRLVTAIRDAAIAAGFDPPQAE